MQTTPNFTPKPASSTVDPKDALRQIYLVTNSLQVQNHRELIRLTPVCAGGDPAGRDLKMQTRRSLDGCTRNTFHDGGVSRANKGDWESIRTPTSRAGERICTSTGSWRPRPLKLPGTKGLGRRAASPAIARRIRLSQGIAWYPAWQSIRQMF